MTSISLHGGYACPDEEYAAPKFGRPKDRRSDLKQVRTGIVVTGDGGIPVLHRAYDGGAGEVARVVPMMKALQQIATTRRVYVKAEALAGLDLGLATRVDYIAARDQGKTPASGEPGRCTRTP